MAYVSCDSCYSRYMISDDKIGKYGRTVKCSKCSNIWHVSRNDNQDTTIIYDQPRFDRSNISFEQGINLPAIRQTKIPYYFYIVPIIFATLLTISTNAFGIFNQKNKVTDFVAITHVKIYNSNDNKTVVYKIKNNDIYDHHIPSVRIKLLDNNGQIIKNQLLHNKIVLEGKQSTTVKTNFKSIKSNIRKAEVTFEEGFKLWSR